MLPRCSADGETGHLARLVRVVLRVADLRAVVFLGDRLAVVFALLVRFFVLRDAAVFRVVVFLAVDRLVDRVAFFAVVLRLVAALVDRFFVVRVADDFFGDRFAVAFFVVRLLAVVFLVDRLAVVALVERFVPVVFLDAALRVVAMEYDSSSTFSILKTPCSRTSKKQGWDPSRETIVHWFADGSTTETVSVVGHQ